MAIAVLDTNVLVNDPLLEGKALTSLLANANVWGLTIAVPDVVVMEIVNKVEQKADELTQQAGKFDTAGVFGIREQRDALVEVVKIAATKYEQTLRDTLSRLGIQVLPVPSIDHMEIARRAAKGIAPYSEKKKDGYRDTLIWFTLRSIANRDAGHDVWYVSQNTQDFADPGSSGDFPSFHPDLLSELESDGTAERVRYAKNLKSLETKLAAQFTPLDTETSKRFEDAIDQDQLGIRVARLLIGRLVKPAAMALPNPATAAEIVGATEQTTGWVFSDESIREDGTRTARFVVDVRGVIEATEESGVSEYDRTVQVSGLIELSMDETISLTITSIDASEQDKQNERVRRQRKGFSWRGTFQDDVHAVIPSSIAEAAGRQITEAITSNPALGEMAQKARDQLSEAIANNPAVQETAQKALAPALEAIANDPAVQEATRKALDPALAAIANSPAVQEAQRKLREPAMQEAERTFRDPAVRRMLRDLGH